MARLQINTGVKSYEIEDENGKLLGTIYIYPNDFNFGKRAEDARKNIVTLVEKAEEIANDETKDAANEIFELDRKIKAELDTMFNSNVSETVFNGLNCLNLNNGEYFIIRFLNLIVPVITKEMEKSAKESNNRIDKYASQASKR
ncbi:hypothetical protein [Anaerosporobacter faecicola]|uniref:hypothetical protein n=1 Tax=Anaerosporobacter faecicola TaxID=2718714 RepID=UPI0014386E80|nr:hypothetical protein [Anaerosporobacter faecicola]